MSGGRDDVERTELDKRIDHLDRCGTPEDLRQGIEAYGAAMQSARVAYVEAYEAAMQPAREAYGAAMQSARVASRSMPARSSSSTTSTSRICGVDMTQRIEAYGAAMQSARVAYVEAYEAAMQPAREAYGAAMQSAREAHGAAMQSAREAHGAAMQSAREAHVEAYEAAIQPAREAYGAAMQSAWEALACGDPLVDWIVSRCAQHKDESLTILRALPADLGVLDSIADVERWCDAWKNLRDEAIRAGVISR